MKSREAAELGGLPHNRGLPSRTGHGHAVPIPNTGPVTSLP
jgi:hypothetical protein